MLNEDGTSRFATEEHYILKSKFEAMTGIQTRDLDQLCINHSNGIPLLELIVALHKSYKLVRTSLKGSGVNGDDASVIKAQQESEKLTAYEIKNQTNLGLLIEKDIAKVRMIDTLAGVQNLIILALKQAAVEFEGDSRRNEEKLTEIFIDSSDRILDEQAIIVDWAMDGGSSLLPTAILTERMVQSRLDKRADVDLDQETKLRDTDINPLQEVDNEFDVMR